MTEYNYRVIVTKENGKQIKLAPPSATMLSRWLVHFFTMKR